LNELSNYMLYNFHDTPQDLYARMRLNIDLNEELGTRIFSFPMRYQPTDMKDRSHVGEHWTRYQLRSMQIILQATHGIVSGSPDFFRRAFGESFEEFEILLLRPERFIFNRAWYEELDGRAEFEQFQKEFDSLTRDESTLLAQLLSSSALSKFKDLKSATTNPRLKSILNWYPPLPDAEEAQIWRKAKEARKTTSREKIEVPDDERVEDAGLAEAA
jgi:hypothetical protein